VNILVPVTLETSQLLSGWLKAEAPLNMSCIFVTLETSQLLSGWLKVIAL
jgi:hypothetical protein